MANVGGGPNDFFSRVGGTCPPANILWRRPCTLHNYIILHDIITYELDVLAFIFFIWQIEYQIAAHKSSKHIYKCNELKPLKCIVFFSE